MSEETPRKIARRLREEGIREAEQSSGVDECELQSMNSAYSVVRAGGKTRVLTFDQQIIGRSSRQVPCYMSFEDFRNLHCNRTVLHNGKDMPLGSWWLRHPDRKQYDGVVFAPGAEPVINGRLNLWRGWGVEERPGRWDLMRRHIDEVLADGDLERADYIIRWVAWAFQHPGERAEAALVFRGLEGCGKGTLGNSLCRIFGQHAMHVSDTEHLTGKFNSHLSDCSFLYADEAVWGGDKRGEGALKRLISEPTLFIERKGLDGEQVANSLHVLISSNEAWVIPAGERSRRHVVLDVPSTHVQDDDWFGPIYAEIENGGLSAMLHDMLHMDLGDWHPRRILRTAELLDQQARGLGAEDEWWVGLLNEGSLPASDRTHPNRAISGDYTETTDVGGVYREIHNKGLMHHARVSSPRLRHRSDHHIGKFLSSKGCVPTQLRRKRAWEFPTLEDARAAWERRFPGWTWDRPDIATWGDQNGEEA
jgi:Family of unknown function (DUF5906)